MTKNGKVVVRGTETENNLDATVGATGSVISPSADVLETTDAYILMVDMPGVAKERIRVTIDRESLTVRGSTDSLQPQDVELVFSEIRSGTYLREFTLGRGIDRDNINATYERGVLSLRLPKHESLRPREIPVR